MGKFANAPTTEFDGARIFGDERKIGLSVDHESSELSGFEAMGKPVPMYRRAAAYEHAKAMGCTDKEKTFACIQRMADYIERDNPHMAMETALGHRDNPLGIVDAIGVYRLLSVLLTAEKPKDPEPVKEMIHDEWGF